MAIVYSYPKVTSPLATDVLVITDTTVTAGKRKNKTKSIAMSDVATYVINTKSGITGSGTVNKFPIFTASTVVGNSIITQAALGQGITVGGNLDVTNDTNLQGSLLADSLEVTNDSVFIGSARFNGTIKDTSGGVGTNGQVLTSTGTGVAWATDAGGSVTGTGTTNYIAKWNTSSSIQNSIIFDNGTNVGIGTTSPQAKLHINSQQPLFVTDGNEVSLSIDAGNYIYSIGDISGGENQSYMQIDSAASKAFFLNSNVGIGTNSPVSIGGHSGVLTLYGSNATALALKDAVSEGHLRFDDSNFKFTNSGGTVRMQIEADTGNVGIGTTSPSAKLHVNSSDSTTVQKIQGATSAALEFFNSTTKTGAILLNSSQFLLAADASNPLTINTGGSERMRITNSGNVGIGTTSPYAKLNVIPSSNPTTPTTANQIAIGESSANSLYNLRLGYFLEGGAYRGSIQSIAGNTPNTLVLNGDGGNVGIGTISPVAKLHVKVNDSGATPIAQQHLILENNSATGIGILTPSATSGYLFFGDNNDAQRGFISYDHSSDSMAFKVSGSERMRIDSSGNVGIGTTSPNVKLDVNGEIAIRGGEDADDPRMYFRASDQSNRFTIETDFDGSSTNDILGFRSVNTDNILTLKGNGNVGIGTTSPASKLTVTGGDAEVTGSDKGLILESPNGTRYRIKVDNSGNLTTTAV